ncbi:four-carbon acid sugar kinase family protein [Lysinibacillus telephonicus]|uniref:Four-carbon acid sugar kinase family protein n=1 Tax=Lysinibacillus telephonicus TaxID=1714840 RepID=A0A431UR20_9BACI|nr:four-carbon acid sugar kinase family protein [Lysinibacillus telephonicus]RTQ92649.1 four-carbon acid sugar kinase family protein [Lysinibacillus telephonicus]
MKVGYIADDLTGSNATAVLLKKLGLQTATVMNGATIPQTLHFDVIGMDLDCRYMHEDIVEKRVREAITELQYWGTELIANRIDSTMRGRIGFITDLLLDAAGKNGIAVISPAFPDSGRKVIGGYLLLHDELLENTSLNRDPMNPVNQSYVPNIVQSQSKNLVAHIGLHEIRLGEENVKKIFQEKIENGCKIIIVDAITNEDIQIVARGMATMNYNCFPVDPGPLTFEFIRAKYFNHNPKINYIFSIGSVSDLTKKQLAYVLEKEQNCEYIYLDPIKLLNPSKAQSIIENAINKAIKQFARKNIFIISTTHPSEANVDLREIAQEQNVSQELIAKKLTTAIANVTTQLILLDPSSVGGVICCGGDVTASLCNFVSADAIKLIEEVESLIAYGELVNGKLDRLPIITKGGLIGNKTTLHQCLRYLQSINTKGIIANES